MAAAVVVGDTDVVNMRTMMPSMSDSITALQNQMATLMEDPETFMNRARGSTDPGPAVRERSYDHEIEKDRTRMMQIEEVLRLNASRLDEIESNLAFYSSELSDDRNKMNTMDEALKVLRNDFSSSRVSVNGTRGDKQIVTSIRGFDKLKMYKGAAVEWKEWRFKLITWLSQSTPSYETLIVKLDYCASEPTEPADGVTMTAGTSELTTEEEWCSEQLYHPLVQKCEVPALDIIRNQNTKGKARGLVPWYRTLREAEGQVPQKRSEITEKVFQPDRKAVAAKDVVSTLEAYEADIREYQMLTGNTMEDTMKVINLKRMMPEAIRERLETLDLQTY